MTAEGDEAAVASALDTTHIHVASDRSYNHEDVLQSAIYLAYIYLLNTHICIKEMTTGKGFVDVVYIPVKKENPAFIIELKRNDSSESAIEQIKEKGILNPCSIIGANCILWVSIMMRRKKRTVAR